MNRSHFVLVAAVAFSAAIARNASADFFEDFSDGLDGWTSLLWEQGVGASNPLAPTIITPYRPVSYKEYSLASFFALLTKRDQIGTAFRFFAVLSSGVPLSHRGRPFFESTTIAAESEKQFQFGGRRARPVLSPAIRPSFLHEPDSKSINLH